jgi:hypothetical protein
MCYGLTQLTRLVWLTSIMANLIRRYSLHPPQLGHSNLWTLQPYSNVAASGICDDVLHSVAVPDSV